MKIRLTPITNDRQRGLFDKPIPPAPPRSDPSWYLLPLPARGRWDAPQRTHERAAVLRRRIRDIHELDWQKLRLKAARDLGIEIQPRDPIDAFLDRLDEKMAAILNKERGAPGDDEGS